MVSVNAVKSPEIISESRISRAPFNRAVSSVCPDSAAQSIDAGISKVTPKLSPANN